ncbi:hypothetical protein, partial [Mycobacterium marinum]|uniref:hypothetical protein n=1 Tax=Mycobacterium marinum TaxID=1781 RepID=UPI00356A15AB
AGITDTGLAHTREGARATHAAAGNPSLAATSAFGLVVTWHTDPLQISCHNNRSVSVLVLKREGYQSITFARVVSLPLMACVMQWGC